MKLWRELFAPPRSLNDRAVEEWFSRIAERLLNGTSLLVRGEPHRLIEIEIYLNAHGHQDPFAHAHPIQRELGRWYFHRTGEGYRGGTFKGVDLCFGDGHSHGGILLRSLETSTGELVSGPSLTVDYLLRQTEIDAVSRLDRLCSKSSAWRRSNPLYLEARLHPRREILATARVGLSLLRAKPSWSRFLLRPYRFVTHPETIRKGKVQCMLALHRQGIDIDEIQRRTRSPRPTIKKCIWAYEAGREAGEFEDYFGTTLTSTSLCRLQGIADRDLA